MTIEELSRQDYESLKSEALTYLRDVNHLSSLGAGVHQDGRTYPEAYEPVLVVLPKHALAITLGALAESSAIARKANRNSLAVLLLDVLNRLGRALNSA